jgi:hypothetical protein
MRARGPTSFGPIVLVKVWHGVYLRLPTRKTESPCFVCGKPIQPGQLYVPPADRPRHLGCRPQLDERRSLLEDERFWRALDQEEEEEEG